MAPIVPHPERIKSFRSAKAFASWLSANHDKQPELWLKIHKKDSGLPTVTAAEALDIVLCWGWIDSTRKSFDERSFLQRYSPRGAKSVWSQINRDSVARLTADGRMTPHGQRRVDAAKADGRWDAAYAPMRSATHALAFRMNKIKTPDGRAKKIATFVETLARGETIVPGRPRSRAKPR